LNVDLDPLLHTTLEGLELGPIYFVVKEPENPYFRDLERALVVLDEEFFMFPIFFPFLAAPYLL
jgi:hypothetical protein